MNSLENHDGREIHEHQNNADFTPEFRVIVQNAYEVLKNVIELHNVGKEKNLGGLSWLSN
jgi:hypothetical protein